MKHDRHTPPRALAEVVNCLIVGWVMHRGYLKGLVSFWW